MSDQPTLREFLEQRFDAQDDKLDSLIVKADTTNGRLRAAETAIAVLKWATGAGGIALGWLLVKAIGR